MPLLLLDADVERQHPAERGRHRPALRRRHRAPPAPGDPARHRRRAGPARHCGHRRPGVPHQRGPRRLPRPGAHPPADQEPGPGLRRGASRRCGPGTVFTTHTPVPAGHRPVPARADGALLRERRRRVRPRGRPAHGARAPSPSGDPTRCSTWRSWACGWPAGQRRRRAARRRCAGRCSRAVARRRSTRCRSARSPTACTPAPGSTARWPTCSSRDRAPTDRGSAPTLGAAGRRPGRRRSGSVRRHARERLVDFVRSRLRAAWLARGASERQLGWTDACSTPRC